MLENDGAGSEKGSSRSDELVLYSVKSGIGRLTLNTPHNLNALSMLMRRRIVELLRLGEDDPTVKVLLIEGAGSSFCSGYDLSVSYGKTRALDGDWVRDPDLEGWTDQFARSILRDWMTIWDLLKPVVVKAHGNCLAGGTELLSMADIAFASSSSRLGFPPMRGMSTPDVPYFPWKMTMARAKYLQLTGNSLTGDEAAAWGWIAKSFPDEEFHVAVEAEVEALASISSDLLAANKHSVNQAYEIMGMRTHFAQAWSWHVLSGQYRPHHSDFSEHVRSDGLKGGLAWMNGPFTDRGIS